MYLLLLFQVILLRSFLHRINNFLNCFQSHLNSEEGEEGWETEGRTNVVQLRQTKRG